MAVRLLRVCMRQNIPFQTRATSDMVFYDKIGNRDVVAFGYNGEESYLDRIDFPMPAIRFKANTPDVMALREKEKGDWKKLSIEEKKALYRASFCQTFSEINAPTGVWKGCIGVTLLGWTLALWILLFCRHFAFPPLPETFDEEHRRAQLERMMILEVDTFGKLGKED